MDETHFEKTENKVEEKTVFDETRFDKVFWHPNKLFILTQFAPIGANCVAANVND